MSDGSRGSKERCAIVTGRSPEQVAAWLEEMTCGRARVDPREQAWMPRGRQHPREAELDKEPTLIADAKIREELVGWWLKKKARTPNWDIAARCAVDEKPGFVLIEAKAHENEFGEQDRSRSTNCCNQEQIKGALAEATNELRIAHPGAWNLQMDEHYQLANRFAWGWKLASLGFPVILVYLGFLKADEMADRGPAFDSSEMWERSLRAYARGFVPDSAWNTEIPVGKATLIPLIRSAIVPTTP